MASMSAREFNQNVSKATRIADKEPVFVTRRGTIEYVLININAYEELQKEKPSLLSVLYMPGVDEIDLESCLEQRKEEPYREVFE